MKKKVIIISGILVLLAAIIILNIGREGDYKNVEVHLTKVEEIVSIVSAPGEIRAEKEVDICSDITARVIRVAVNEGQDVERGDTLFMLASTIYEADVKQGRARLTIAEAELKRAKNEFERMKSLFENRLVSMEEFERAEIELEITEARRKEVSAALKFAIFNLNKTTITSPISGKVIDINIEEGEIAIAGAAIHAGTILAKVVDTENMIAEVRVKEADIVNIHPNQRAEIRIRGFHRELFTGRVVEIGGKIPSLEDKREFRVRLRIDNPPTALRPGISCDVEIETARVDSAIIIPIKAIRGDSVFVMRENIAKMIPVETGISDGMNIEIKEGVDIGEEVIVGPFKLLRTLKDGDRIKKVR